jgi:hypothetical protein
MGPLAPLPPSSRRWLAQLLINVGFPDSAQQLAHDIVQPTPLQGA